MNLSQSQKLTSGADESERMISGGANDLKVIAEMTLQRVLGPNSIGQGRESVLVLIQVANNKREDSGEMSDSAKE